MEIGLGTGKRAWKEKLALALAYGVLSVIVFCLIDWILGNEFKSMAELVIQGAFFGLAFGFIFPHTMGLVTSNFGKTQKPPDLTKGETIEVEGPANLFRGIEGVGGKLYLTNQGIVFAAHQYNIQRGQTNIMYSNISDVLPRKTSMFDNNGIKLIINDNRVYHFVVNERDLWLEKLSERIGD